MVAKHGFSPIEQYSKSGKVGPWTDIYAMAATIYYCCTGILPPPATDRTIDDTLACQPLLTQAQFDILADCMRMRPQDRPQSMDTLLQMLTHPQGEAKAEPPKVIPEVEPPKPVETKAAPPKPMETEPVVQKTQPINPEAQPTQPPRHDVKPERPLSKWLIPGVAAVVAVIALAISIGSGGKKSAPAPSVKVPTVQRPPPRNRRRQKQFLLFPWKSIPWRLQTLSMKTTSLLPRFGGRVSICAKT